MDLTRDPTAVDLVRWHLHDDLAMEAARARGYLNVRRAARWLLAQHGWDTTEEAVVSAIRRYEPRDPLGLDQAYNLLNGAHFTSRTGLGLVRLPWSWEVLDRLPRLHDIGEVEDHVSILTGYKDVRLVLERQHVSEALDVFGGVERSVHRDVGEIRFKFRDQGPAVPVAMAVFLNNLGQRGVDILETFACGPGLSVYFPGVQTIDAYGVADAMNTLSGRP